MNKSHELLDFMISISHEMGLEYDRIQKRATEDPVLLETKERKTGHSFSVAGYLRAIT